MKSVSFLCGALVGAAAVIWSAKRNGGKLAGSNGIMKLAGMGMNPAGKGSGQGHTSESEHKHNSTAFGDSKVHPSSASSSSDAGHSKEYSVRQITDFIKGNADVRREVEQILKETNSVIPGL
ncbi:hypothetical protein YSY43_24170 [Paenibacillus sp. YSY-4.3]